MARFLGTRFSWIFDDPRSDEGLPYDAMLECFRQVREEVEIRIESWLEHPEAELTRLKEQREAERQEANRREVRKTEIRDAFAAPEGERTKARRRSTAAGRVPASPIRV